MQGYEVSDERDGPTVDQNMLLGSGSKGCDHVGHDSTFNENFILDDLDSYWGELNDRLSVSRMVNDSVIKGMVNAVVEEAADKIASKEAEITLLNEKLQSYESDIAACRKMESPLTMSKHLMVNLEKEKAISESHRSYLSASRNWKHADHVKQLNIVVEEQIQRMKEDLQFIKSLNFGCNGNADVRSHSISPEAKPTQKLLEIDESFDALKSILATGFEQISGLVCSNQVVISELQWEHELQGEIIDIVFKDYVRGLQDEYDTRLYEQKTYINNNWLEKAAKLSKMRDELKTISEEVNSHETFEEWNVSRRKDHIAGKAFLNHNLLSHSVENGTLTMETSVDFGEDMLDIADLPQLKHMSKEELITHCKTVMTKMRRFHDSALQEKTEELFRLKREFLKEKGSLPFRKEKEYEHIKKKVPEFVLSLDEILLEKEILSPLYNNDDNLHSFKDRINSLLVDNERLRNLLMKKTKELNYLSSQASDAESKVSFHSTLEANYLKQIRSLERDIKDVKIEANVRSGLSNTILRELVGEHRHMMEDMMEDAEIKFKYLQEVCTTVFREVVHDVISSVNPAIIKFHAEKTALKALVSEKEQELTLKSKENQNLEQVIKSKTTLVEEKETFASKTESIIKEQRQQLDLVHHELDMLKEKLNKQEVHILSLRKELNTTDSRLNEALQQNYKYERKMVKLNEKLRIASNAVEEADKQKILLHSIIEDKEKTLSSSFHRDTEQVKQFECIIVSMAELSKAFADLESRFTESSEKNTSRLKILSHQFNVLLQQAGQQTKKCLWYKQMLETRCSNLEKAEAEVDLLGDEVDALLGLLGRIYLALDHYSPVLQHYPGVMEILKLVQRELNGENN